MRESSWGVGPWFPGAWLAGDWAAKLLGSTATTMAALARARTATRRNEFGALTGRRSPITRAGGIRAEAAPVWPQNGSFESAPQGRRPRARNGLASPQARRKSGACAPHRTLD